ncbi:MAG TPA: hypothetical protein VF840_14185 [Terriglobales bacterium]
MKKLRVADQAWIATALLHRENPDSVDFSLKDIIGRADQEFGHPLQPGVWQHIVSHGVAQNDPTPARLRMFTKTARSRRRLFRPGDTFCAERTGRTYPDPLQLDERHRPLVDWYVREYAPNGNRSGGSSPPPSSSPRVLLEFVGTISAYDLKVMAEVIERDCERIEDERPS